MYLLLAWRNIWRNRRRTLITLASVAFAVFFSSLMQSMQTAAWGNLIDNAVRFYTGYIQIHHQGYWDDRTLDNSFVNQASLQSKVAQHPGVVAVVPRLESFALASGTDRTKGTLVIGIDPEKEDNLTNLRNKMRAGTYLQAGQKKVLVAEGLADFLRLAPKDTLVLIGQGYHGANAAGKYEVAGIVKFPSTQLNDQVVYLPLPEAQWLYDTGDRLTSLSLLVDDPGKVEDVTATLQQELNATQFEVMNWQELMPELVQGFEIDRIGAQVILIILYAVISFGIFGTFLMMTTERRYEMGVMLAIGMSRLKLQSVMFLEILMLALGGTLLGILVSLPVILYMHNHPIPVSGNLAELYQNYGMEPVLPFSRKSDIFLRQAYTVAIITAVLGIYPLWFIQRLIPVTALRS
ncbi:ABC transporter permease [Pontibacter anaerobius]|uniref:FtsX-like permease family protein n=1 Tax=Pontibacter anaerobius TaxID=2993940 RepID=A0ABT3RD94_9BACT|nr:ABC transporter permease [Pontibacter anaerobius]MCX2739814.1 FtsX-like permease family protein [Pontibacter anaerobius]